MKDKWNSKWRLPPSWIYDFCPFWPKGLFPVATNYITAKFHSSTSIGGWVIDVRAKIQDGGRRHLEFIIFVHFGQMVYFRWQPSTSLQNFIHLRQSAAVLLMFVQKSKMAAAAILNYNFVMLDHPQSSFVHLKVPCKFRVDRERTFRDITIRKFRKFGLKCLFRPPKVMFLGSFDPQALFFIIETPKRPYLTRKHAFWVINGRDRSSGVTCRREQEYKKRIVHKK